MSSSEEWREEVASISKFTFLPTGLLSKIELLFFFLFLQASNATVPVAGTKHKDAVVKVEDDVVVET